jgi:acetolactate synthase small subunit
MYTHCLGTPVDRKLRRQAFSLVCTFAKRAIVSGRRFQSLPHIPHTEPSRYPGPVKREKHNSLASRGVESDLRLICCPFRGEHADLANSVVNFMVVETHTRTQAPLVNVEQWRILELIDTGS